MQVSRHLSFVSRIDNHHQRDQDELVNNDVYLRRIHLDQH